MNPQTVVDRNLELHAEWLRYLVAHPEAMDRIPEGAQVIILPTDDPALARENTKILTAAQHEGVPVVVVRLASPKPQTPQIEVLSK